MKCDELKSYNSERIYWAVEQVEKEAGDIDDLHLDDNLFYLKSEADKVIAKLKDKLDLYKRGWEENDKVNANLYAELRHHKYKRCLAMAMWCDSEANYWYDSSKVQQCCRYGHYIRWFNKWSKLAEKFKEAK